MSSSGQAVFPLPPPTAKYPMIDIKNGCFTPLGLDLFTKLWNGIQGSGGIAPGGIYNLGNFPPVPTGDLYANVTGATVAPQIVSLSALLDFVAGSARGDILVRGASAWSVLAPGTAGYLLATGGAGADPHWVTTDKASAYLSSAANTVATGWQKIPLDTTSFDTDSIWDGTNKRFIPKKAGYYLVTGRSATTTAGSVTVAIGFNGANTINLGTDIVGATSGLASGGTALVACNGTTDYLELWGNYGAVRALTTGTSDTYMNVSGPV